MKNQELLKHHTSSWSKNKTAQSAHGTYQDAVRFSFKDTSLGLLLRAQHFKLPLPHWHPVTVLVGIPSALFLTQLPANLPEESVKDSPNTRVPAIRVGHSWGRPILADGNLWGFKQQTKSLFLCPSKNRLALQENYLNNTKLLILDQCASDNNAQFLGKLKIPFLFHHLSC